VGAHLSACDALAPTLENLVTDPYGTAPYLAGLLHWDLVNSDLDDPWVVFIDGFEHVAGMQHRDSERRLQTLVYLLPRLLFVVTGRDRLGWADDALVGTLDHVGSAIWPGLADDQSVQDHHLVGFLSDQDADTYLQRELVRGDGTPELDESCRRVIVRAANGLPLYLDLSVTIASDALRRRQPVEPAMFGGPLGEVVRRVVRDMSPGVRRALRAAAMFRGFDAALVSVVGEVSAGDAERLAGHGIVSDQGHPPLRLRVHDAVRSSILRTDADQPDGWTNADWRAAAQRGLDHLRVRVESHPPVNDRITYISVALRLAADFGVEADWVRIAAFKLPLRRLAPRLGTPPESPTSWAEWMHRYLASWNLPPARNVDRFAQLRWLREQEDAPAKLRFSATRHLAYGLRGRGDKAGALPLIEDLLRNDDSNRQLHRYQLGLTYRDLNRFDDVARIVTELQGDDSTSYGLRLQASLDLVHGRVREALAGYQARADHLRSIGNERVGLEQRVATEFIRAMIEPGATKVLDDLQLQAELDIAPSSLIQALGAKALREVGDEAAVRVYINEQVQWASLFDSDPHTVYRVVPACFHRAVLEDGAGLRDELERFATSRRTPAPFWFDIFAGVLRGLGGDPPARPGPTPRWTEPFEVVLGRWEAVIAARR
jgi:hypothetical protein